MMPCKRAALLLPPAILLLAVGAACLPSPDEPIDYVRRENAVIIQLKNVQELSNPSDVSLRMMGRLTVPAFTLYGDGTLFLVREDEEGREELIVARLPKEAILDLVQFIVDEGFLEFTYEQPRPEVPGPPQRTTFLYVNTKDGTNATRAYALNAGSLDGASSDYTEFRRLIKIKERLESLDPLAVGGTVESEYEPEALLLVVVPFTGESLTSPSAWLYPEIDLNEITPPGAELGERIITRDESPDLFADLFFYELQIISQVIEFGEQLFVVSVRPALPFEENFPEFDQP